MHVKRHVVPINLVREDPLIRSRLLFRGAPTHLPRGFPETGLDFCPDQRFHGAAFGFRASWDVWRQRSAA